MDLCTKIIIFKPIVDKNINPLELLSIIKKLEWVRCTIRLPSLTQKEVFPNLKSRKIIFGLKSVKKDLLVCR